MQENGLTLVDLKLKEGDLLTIGIRPPSNLPEFVRWIGPQVNLGEVIYTTRFYGYEHFARRASCRWATRRASTGGPRSSR